MSIITLDFETYYDKEYSLSKLTTEEYIQDKRFEAIGVGIKVDTKPSVWITGKNIWTELKAIDWKNHALLCQNTMFDAGVLSFRYGILPGFYFDTMLMARAKLGATASVSLKSLAARYGLGVKGEAVHNNIGKRAFDFSPAGLADYGVYCCNDVDLCHSLFSALLPFPDDELRLIDLTLRMYTDPAFHVDVPLLNTRLEEIKQEKSAMLQGLMQKLKCSDEESVRKKLSSNIEFAVCLEEAGVEVPIKISPTTGKETYALAKTDEGFIDLQSHPDIGVQQLCAVRLGTKSTLEESRVERFIGIAARNNSKLPIPLRYYGAHTGRWSGTDGVNFQNLPSRDEAKKSLKASLVAPPGYVVINSDSSQIEARVLAWLANQIELVTAFREGRDVYSEFASLRYGRTITKKDTVERFLGKTCILGLGYGTGAEKLRSTLKIQGKVELSLDEAKELVSLYRATYYKIPQLWKALEQDLHDIMQVEEPRYALPNELYLHYANLRILDGKMVYDNRNGIKGIWGGAIAENVTQALARILIGYQMIKIANQGYRPALTVHDSLVYVVPKPKQDEAIQIIRAGMSAIPDWAEGLPLTCEIKVGSNYAEV